MSNVDLEYIKQSFHNILLILSPTLFEYQYLFFSGQKNEVDL